LTAWLLVTCVGAESIKISMVVGNAGIVSRLDGYGACVNDGDKTVLVNLARKDGRAPNRRGT
jgi:hypothetical protein